MDRGVALGLIFGVTAIAFAGCDRTERAAKAPEAPSIQETLATGQAVYITSCLVCHQHDGSGVPGFQPPLIDSAMLAGPVDALVELTLGGSGVLPPDHVASDGGDYAIPMPGFSALSDNEIAALLTYVRTTWGDRVVISPDRVAKIREALERE